MSPQASEGATSSPSPTNLIGQSVAPSSTVEDQLRKEIAGLEEEIRQLKLNQDPSREGVKHALIQEELAQIRETTLNLRVELQMAQEGHRLLEQKHHALENEHERCKKLMQEAVENLSTGLEPSKRESTNLGLPIEGVAPNAVQIKEEDHPPALLTVSATKGSPVPAIFGQPSIRSPAVQPLASTPEAFFKNQQIPKSLFTSSGSARKPFPFLAITPSPADGTAAGSLCPPQFKGPAPPMFGDPKGKSHNNYKAYGKTPPNSDPEYWKALKQSFEEASREDNKLYTSGIKPTLTPKAMETFNNIRTSAPRTSVDTPALSRDQGGKKRKFDEQGGW